MNTNQDLELLYRISRELASALNLRTVLQRVLYASLEHVGGERASIVVLNDDGAPIDATIVYGEQTLEHTTQQLRETVERGLAGWVVRQRQAVLVPDTSRDERWLRRPDDAETHSGAKSAICVPLLTREKLVGVLTLVHSQPHSFDEDDLALMQAIADQAGIAVLNARLYAESQRQARVMTALAESAMSINASLQLDEVFFKILRQVSQALQVQTAAVALVEGQDLVIVRALGEGSRRLQGVRLDKDKGIFAWVLREGRGTVVPLVQQDERFAASDNLPSIETHALACAPLRAGRRTLGLLIAINPLKESFDRDTLLMMTGIGSLAGLAIQNARLFQRLDVAHRRYRELFEESIDPIILTDLDGQVLEANRMALRVLGFDLDTIKTMTVDQLHEVLWSKVGMDFELVSDESPARYESALYKRNGTISVEVYVHRVPYEGNVVLRWTFRDISERKELDILRNDLTSMIYHDLRSPLANISSSLDLLRSLAKIESDDQLQAVMRIAEHSVGRIQRLLSSLLDLNRLEAGQPIVSQQVAEARHIVAEAVAAVRPQAGGRQQRIKVLLDDTLRKLWVDPDMILRVLTNLLENAIKFSPAGSTIYVGVREEDSMALFWVQDEGPGIPPEEAEHIFDKFKRLRSEKGPKGLGIGLAFCRLAVNGHGGKIWVESQPGQGCTFYFTLPFAPPGTY